MSAGPTFLALLSGLAEVAAVLAAVFAAFVVIREWSGRQPLLQRLLLAALFAAGVAWGTAFPVTLGGGVIVEPRAALLALAGLVGGPLVAGAALLTAVACEVAHGGAVLAGIAGSLVAGGAGLALWWLAGRNREPASLLAWRPLLLAAAGAAVAALPGPVLASSPVGGGLAALTEAAAPALVQAGGVLLLGRLFGCGVRRPHSPGSAAATPAAPGGTEEAPGGAREPRRPLDRQDALNRAILETLADGLVVMEPDGTIRVFNPMAERIFGWRADEIVGGNVRLLIADHGAGDGPDGTTPEPVARLRAAGAQAAAGTRREVLGRRRDGSNFPLEIALAEIADPGGDGERYLLGLVRDVTERRRSIDALIEARSAAEVAQRTQRDFLAHMSHELRTPLNSILGFSELIQLATVGPLPDKYREYAASIHLAGDHLLRLINDVLDLSKIEQGHLTLHEERVRPEDLLDAVARLFKPKAEERRIVLDVQPPEPPFDLLGDFVRLRQILFNLVSNAIKFSPPGSAVRVSIGRAASGEVLFAVADHGIGMTAEDAELALKPFRQVRSEFTRSHEGTGLGLSISRSLAEHHDGSLEIDSAPQQGTTVTVRLPSSRVLPRDDGAA